MIGLVAALFAVYLGLVACVWQWGTPSPASRIDLFSGGFFAAGPLWIAEYLVFLRAIGRSKEVQAEASGATFDPLAARADRPHGDPVDQAGGEDADDAPQAAPQ